MKRLFLLSFGLICLFYGCIEEDTEPNNFSIEGVRPIYVASESLDDISTQPAQDFDNLGKIVVKNEYIYIVERLRGIHVINNIDPTAPQKEFFYNIPGCSDFAIKGNILYAENGLDLKLIDISNPSEISLINTTYDIYKDEIQNLFPTNYNGYFECVEEDKGVLIGWENALLTNPKCWR